MALNEFGAGFKIQAKDFASGVFRRVGKNFTKMSDKTEASSRRMQAGIQRIGKGLALVGAGYAITRPIKSAVMESMKLNKALAEVSTLTDEATFPITKMKGLVKGLAAEYGANATLQAKALYQTISAGYGEAAQAAKLMTTANKLAVGGVTEVETAVDGLTNVMSTYSSENLEALDVSDAMFVAMKEGKTTIGELSSQIGSIAPGAAAMGIEFDQLFASISAITSMGINTAASTSGLAGALSNIIRPTKEATAEARRLGIAFDAKTLREKGFKGFLDSITSSAKYNDDTISQLFSSMEAFKVMTALTSNEGKKFNDVLEKMGKRSGATDIAVKKMEASLEHQLNRLKEVGRNILTSIGDSAEKLLLPLVKVLQKIGLWIGSFIDSLSEDTKKTILGIVGALGGLISIVGIIMMVSGAISMLGIGLTSLIAIFAALVVSAGVFTLVIGAISISIYSVYKAFKKNTGGITTSFKSMTKQLKLAWSGMMALVRGEDFGRELTKQLNKAENQGVLKFLNNFERFIEKIKIFWKGLVKGFETGVDKLSNSPAMKKLMSTIDGLVAIFTGRGGKDTDPKVLKEWGKQGEKTGERLAKMGETALGAIDDMIAFSKTFVETIKLITADDVNNAIIKTTTAFENTLSVLEDTAFVLSFIYRLLKTVANAFKIVGTSAYKFFDTISGLTNLAPDWIMAKITEDPKRIKDFNEKNQIYLERQKEKAQGTEEILGDFARIWGSKTTFGMTAQQIKEKEGLAAWWKKATGASRATREGRVSAAKDKPSLPMGSRIDDLRGEHEYLIKLMSLSREEVQKKFPSGKEFKELSQEKQERRFDAIEAMIKAMANQPHILQIDGEKMGQSVKDSDAMTGTRDLDPSGAL